MPKKRKSRRVKYYPREVVLRVLSNEVLLGICEILMSESTPLPCGEVARRLGKLLGRRFTTGHVSALLRRLEKWGVVRPYRSPFNGHLLWGVAESKTAEVVAAELRRRESEKLMDVLRRVGIEV